MKAVETPGVERINLLRAISLAEAAKLMRGRNGRPPSVDTVRRWARPDIGYRPWRYDGPSIVLRTVRTCNDVVTLEEWVEEFNEAQAQMGLRGGGPGPKRQRTLGVVGRPAPEACELERRAREG